ncbi:nucleotidyltransferase domain-containing protein [Plebeiibacterium marinum]|uniref:Nucleotidyltransferase domain-containing protein n=1 Tax=Plebeiibacterium marinum TaxID=2992111 RepID=A0AAE3MHC3_9BACT|nr:nucleotidyltransferase domain-containing protein [Plebeiobacterium marinum]MCW3807621.1 nucleotidyltransferase domain-containing protein [Plebeiobacterium marinum]
MGKDETIKQKIKQIVKEKAPRAEVYLYGSRARGTSTPESDWDILILLISSKITDTEEKEITYPLYDLEIDTGEVISPMIYTEEEWNNKYSVTPFYHNVMRERQQI